MNLRRWKNGIEGDEELDEEYITLTKRDYEGRRASWQTYGFGLGIAAMALFVIALQLAMLYFMK